MVRVAGSHVTPVISVLFVRSVDDGVGVGCGVAVGVGLVHADVAMMTMPIARISQILMFCLRRIGEPRQVPLLS